MKFPTTIFYDIPTFPGGESIENAAPLNLDADRVVIVVQDMQSCFLAPYDDGCPALTHAIASMKRIIDEARKISVPVAHVIREAESVTTWHLHDEFWGQELFADPSQADIVKELEPEVVDSVLRRNAYSALAGEDLVTQLKMTGRDQIILIGLYAHIGITATALDAFTQDIYPFVVSDAVLSFNSSLHNSALELIAESCGSIISTDKVVEVFSKRTGPSRSVVWEEVLYQKLVRGLGVEAADKAFEEPDYDLFNLGLNSIQAFSILDDLADNGVDIEFSDFVHYPTLEYLRKKAGAV